MVTVDWAFICERTETDNLSYLTAHRIYSTLVLEEGGHGDLTAVCRLSVDVDTTITFDVVIQHPDQSFLGEHRPHPQRIPANKSINLTQRITGVPLHVEGTYLFHFMVDGTAAKVVPLRVVILPKVLH